jgi:hypothetical protein
MFYDSLLTKTVENSTKRSRKTPGIFSASVITFSPSKMTENNWNFLSPLI